MVEVLFFALAPIICLLIAGLMSPSQRVKRWTCWLVVVAVVFECGMLIAGMAFEGEPRGPGGLGTFNFSVIALAGWVIQWVVSPVVWCIVIGLVIYNVYGAVARRRP